MQLFFHDKIRGTTFELDQKESGHIAKVLRKNIGDMIYFTNGKGSLFTCMLEDNNPLKCRLKVIEQSFTPPEKFHIHLAIAPTKNTDRMEWMLEKLTEMGIDEITFLKTTRIERNRINLDRMEKKLVAACKQSFKTWLPHLNDMVDFNDLIIDKTFQTHQRFIAYIDKDNTGHLINLAQPSQSYLVLIGPEGDFSPGEIEAARKNGFQSCSLGKHRLRTETAGLVAVHTLNLLNL
ncbi:MAG: 16S rRNA (uracil(1498)-N(3))-methyltransferase [Cyclobacteriaceae bacterium]